VATERLQKLLAAAGLGSRRACEELILEGRVRVNGTVVDRLPVLVDPQRDHVSVDGRPVRAEHTVYYMLHKPRGVVCTNRDPAGRRRAVDLLGGVRERVYPVGRLDAESTGLLLMTNDGELAARLTHPRYGVPKTYRAEVAGRVGPQALERLRAGVWLSDGRTGRADASIIYQRPDSTVLEITLREGRNREVRRVLAKLGHKVYRLKRIRIGGLSLKGLPPGGFRPLRPDEVRGLTAAAVATATRSAAISPPPRLPPPRAPRGRMHRQTGPGRSDRGRTPGRGRRGRRPARRGS
jgi:23S rRNA pseudouridine2605 synthase